MLASITFDKILKEIQSSNLNFQCQVSSFSTVISLKAGKGALAHRLQRLHAYNVAPLAKSKMATKENKMEKRNIMMFIVATNVIASRPPKRQPTGTPSARANLSRPTLIQDTERSSVSASEDRLKGVS